MHTPNGIWQYSIFVAETDFGAFDNIVVFGAVKHLIEPHPTEGEGTPLPFALFVLPFNANFNGGNIGEVQQTSTFSVVHGQHSDVLVAALRATVDRSTGSFEITNWTLTIDTVHTAEPATMILLGTGLAGVALKTRKRLKNRKSG